MVGGKQKEVKPWDPGMTYKVASLSYPPMTYFLQLWLTVLFPKAVSLAEEI